MQNLSQRTPIRNPEPLPPAIAAARSRVERLGQRHLDLQRRWMAAMELGSYRRAARLLVHEEAAEAAAQAASERLGRLEARRHQRQVRQAQPAARGPLSPRRQPRSRPRACGRSRRSAARPALRGGSGDGDGDGPPGPPPAFVCWRRPPGPLVEISVHELPPGTLFLGAVVDEDDGRALIDAGSLLIFADKNQLEAVP